MLATNIHRYLRQTIFISIQFWLYVHGNIVDQVSNNYYPRFSTKTELKYNKKILYIIYYNLSMLYDFCSKVLNTPDC